MKTKKPLVRPDSKAPHPNPVRAFREELRLNRDEFATLVGIKLETERAWEQERRPVMPTGPRLTKLLACARRNFYPLGLKEIEDYCVDSY